MAFKKGNKKNGNRNFFKFKNAEGKCAKVEEGLIWLKSGQYQTCGVSVALDEATTISDWSRTIALDDVYVSVQTNENGYPTLVISSHPIEE